MGRRRTSASVASGRPYRMFSAIEPAMRSDAQRALCVGAGSARQRQGQHRQKGTAETRRKTERGKLLHTRRRTASALVRCTRQAGPAVSPHSAPAAPPRPSSPSGSGEGRDKGRGMSRKGQRKGSEMKGIEKGSGKGQWQNAVAKGSGKRPSRGPGRRIGLAAPRPSTCLSLRSPTHCAAGHCDHHTVAGGHTRPRQHVMAHVMGRM